jgi:hypothetical protein
LVFEALKGYFAQRRKERKGKPDKIEVKTYKILNFLANFASLREDSFSRGGADAERK